MPLTYFENHLKSFICLCVCVCFHVFVSIYMFIRWGCGMEDGLYLFLPTTLLLINMDSMDTVSQRDSNAMIDQQLNAHYGVMMDCNVMIVDGILIVLIKQLFLLKSEQIVPGDIHQCV